MTSLRRLNRYLRGRRAYGLAAIAAVPDILTALGGFDFSAFLPAGASSKLSAAILLGRLVLSPTLDKMRQVPPPPPRPRRHRQEAS